MVRDFFAASRLFIVAGKGGVGKTTVTAVMAHCAAQSGLRVLVIDVEGRAGLAGMLGAAASDTLSYEVRSLVSGAGPDGTGVVDGRCLLPGDALREYLDEHGFGRISRRLAASGVLDVVSTAAPGIEDLLVLGKVKQLERAGDYDVILLDGPAAGHAIPFLMSAAGLSDSVRLGPIHTQARDVLELLADHQRCQVVLVTTPEQTPINELIETAYALEDRVGVGLAPLIVNSVYPPLGAAVPHGDGAVAQAAAFMAERCAVQEAQLERLAEELPLARLELPFLFTAGLTASDVEELSGALERAIVDSRP